jgi:predicted DNA-binding transcriptional regulator YafY
VRRADRLFRLVGLLQRRRTVTAATLAERLEVSERTVYRDVADLIASGVPIQGEAGIGYRLERGFDLPPLMFTEAEIEAVVLGTRLVEAVSDPELSRAAQDVLAKIRTVVPPKLLAHLDETRLYGLGFGAEASVAISLHLLRQSLRILRKVHFSYDDAKGQKSERTVRPLGLSFVGHAWMLTGWCELRDGFRNFRLDRMTQLVQLPDSFVPEPGKRFEDFLRLLEVELGPPPKRGTR